MAQVLTRVHGTARQIPKERLPSSIVIANKEYLGLIACHDSTRDRYITTISHFLELNDAPQAPLEEITRAWHFESPTERAEFCPQSVINLNSSQMCLLMVPPAAQQHVQPASRDPLAGQLHRAAPKDGDLDLSASRVFQRKQVEERHAHRRRHIAFDAGLHQHIRNVVPQRN